VSLVSLVLLAACREPPVVEPPVAEPGSVDSTWSASSELPAGPTREQRQPGGCGTLTDAEEPEVLRLARGQEGTVLYANAQLGLAIVDVSDPDAPKLTGVSELTGTPVGIFEMNGAAVIVYAPWDRPAETVVRAVEIGPRVAGRTIGEIVLAGAPRDARRVGDVLVVTRDFTPAGTTMTAVTTFMLDENGLSKRDEHRLAGRGAVTGGSPHGVAVAREAEAELGGDRTSVTWLGIASEELGVIRLHGTSTVAGVIPRWRRASDHVIDVAEDARVRVVGCATSACPAGEAAAYAAIDFAEPDRPRLTSWSLLARAGDGVFNFDGDRLIVARPPADRSDGTDLAFFRTNSELVPAGSVRLRGTIGSIAVRHGGDVVALGWTGSATAGKRAIVHHVDARRSPRLLGSTSFGGDWTWSPAYDDDRAISFDPASTLAALPMTTMRGQSGAFTAAQVLSFGPVGPRNVMEKEVTVADRLLFVDGRLLAFSSEGVTVVRHPGEHRSQRSWDDLRTLGR
jgi:hypothetical protein